MSEKSAPERLVALEDYFASFLPGPALTLLERFLGCRTLNDVYAKWRKERGDSTAPVDFFKEAVRVLGIRWDVSDEDLARIPTSGPVVVVANHPFGGMDGIILGALLAHRRQDTRLLVNYLVKGLPFIENRIFCVDPFARQGAARSSVSGVRKTIQWLEKGGLVATFPAGMVSHLHLKEFRVVDRRWNPNVARMIRMSGAMAIPVFFEGRNSLQFQVAGLLHRRLRTLLLGRELIKNTTKRPRIRIGPPISYVKLAGFKSNRDMTAYLRLSTYLLARRAADPAGSAQRKTRPARGITTVQQPIHPAIPKSTLRNEVSRLRDDHALVRQGDFTVFIARSWKIPNILTEIGRLREITFRAAAEGTGRSLAIERCDRYYEHLFLWNNSTSEVVGAYRIGRTDRILRWLGPKGLYTSKLFDYKSELFERLSPALELGRSFIRPEYQRRHNALILIWKGILRYVVRNPECHVLFGAVSTSREYLVISKDIIMEFLQQHQLDHTLARFVKARNPPHPPRFRSSDRESIRTGLRDVRDLSSLISAMESDHKGVPILLKHYLRLNAVILSFNVDKDFGSVMDSLVVVDLLRSDPRIIRRYMGKEGAASFYAYHAAKQPTGV